MSLSNDHYVHLYIIQVIIIMMRSITIANAILNALHIILNSQTNPMYQYPGFEPRFDCHQRPLFFQKSCYFSLLIYEILYFTVMRVRCNKKKFKGKSREVENAKEQYFNQLILLKLLLAIQQTITCTDTYTPLAGHFS